MALHTPLVGLPPKKFRRKFGRNAARDKFEESPQEVREIVLASLGNHEFFLKKVRFFKAKVVYGSTGQHNRHGRIFN